jgi:hypothetical protein
MRMRDDLRAVTLRALDNVVGFKFLSLLLASVFFAIGKLSDTLWIEVVFVVCGLRAATDIAQVVKSAPKKEKAAKPDPKPKADFDKLDAEEAD